MNELLSADSFVPSPRAEDGPRRRKITRPGLRAASTSKVKRAINTGDTDDWEIEESGLPDLYPGRTTQDDQHMFMSAPGGTLAEYARVNGDWVFQRDWTATKNQDATADESLKRLLRSVTIERPRYTDVLLATCVANNPALAQEILATFWV